MPPSPAVRSPADARSALARRRSLPSPAASNDRSCEALHEFVAARTGADEADGKSDFLLDDVEERARSRRQFADLAGRAQFGLPSGQVAVDRRDRCEFVEA